MIKQAYTLNYFKLGAKLQKGWKVYLKYYKNDGKGKRIAQYLPTDTHLSSEDFDKLLADQLGGKTFIHLSGIRQDYVNRIDEFYSRYGHYPSKEQLTEKDKATGLINIEHTINDLVTGCEYRSE